MKEEKKVKIATNTSSGAEKVEIVEEKVENKPQKKTQSAANGSAKTAAQKAAKIVKEKERNVNAEKMNAESSNGKAERESQAAKARVAAAIAKKEEKEKRKKAREKAKAERTARKKAKAEKRAAARKAMEEKRLAERKAREEKRKALEEERARERAHAKAKKSQEKQRAQKKKNTEKKKDGESHKRRGKDYGGWLAAVITLGTVTLALTTAVTVGAIEMNKMNDAAMTGYRATTYEFVEIMENVDEDLDRARVSNSPAQQSRILTDLLVQSRLAAADLEKMPVSAESDRNLTSYINHVAAESERMLAKLRNGETLTQQDGETLQKLYAMGKEVRGVLDSFVANMADEDMMQYVKKGAGKFAGVLENLEKLTLEENNPLQGAKDQESKVAPAEEMKKIDASKAEDYCALYFSDYQISDFQCIGETVGHGYIAYNVQGYDDKGTMLFAEIDGSDGTLLRFDYYEECTDDNFTMENAQMIAETFLEKLGYQDLVAVGARENGTDVDFKFVYEMDGVVVYPDGVQVKVCRTRGVVTGLDATRYALNHKVRALPTVKINLEQAMGKLHDNLQVQSSRLAIVQTARGERLAYEFVCQYEQERYVVYLDAQNGEEISILNLKNLG